MVVCKTGMSAHGTDTYVLGAKTDLTQGVVDENDERGGTWEAMGAFGVHALAAGVGWKTHEGLRVDEGESGGRRGNWTNCCRQKRWETK